MKLSCANNYQDTDMAALNLLLTVNHRRSCRAHKSDERDELVPSTVVSPIYQNPGISDTNEAFVKTFTYFYFGML